jgi:hypothetical protein
VKWVDEVRVYQGGYSGSSDILPKSYESKMDETYPAPPTSVGTGAFLPFMALGFICGVILMRGYRT